VCKSTPKISKRIVGLLFDNFVKVFVSVQIFIEQDLAFGPLVEKSRLRI